MNKCNTALSSAVSYFTGSSLDKDIPRELVGDINIINPLPQLFNPVPAFSEDSPSPYETTSSLWPSPLFVPIKEIKVLRPKEGNLYPSLDEADVEVFTRPGSRIWRPSLLSFYAQNWLAYTKARLYDWMYNSWWDPTVPTLTCSMTKARSS